MLLFFAFNPRSLSTFPPWLLAGPAFLSPYCSWTCCTRALSSATSRDFWQPSTRQREKEVGGKKSPGIAPYLRPQPLAGLVSRRVHGGPWEGTGTFWTGSPIKPELRAVLECCKHPSSLRDCRARGFVKVAAHRCIPTAPLGPKTCGEGAVRPPRT